MLDKPKKKSRSYYDYIQCRDYLQAKYNYLERDYAGKFANGKLNGKPYLDFWHWVLDNHEVHNGCEILFSKEELETIEKPWVKEIYQRYIDEFADKKGELTLYVWW